MNRQLIEVASWQIVSELQRRYFGDLKVIETHPGGGLYDCLSLVDNNLGHIADFDREGRFHVFRRYDGQPTPKPMKIWDKMLDYEDPRLLLDEISGRIGLPISKKLPPSNPTILTYRFIACFLKHSVFGMRKWECRNGYFDTSGYESGTVSDFQVFPSTLQRLRIALPDDVLKEPAYRFWFLRRDDVPVACLETATGSVWVGSLGEPYQLAKLYEQNGRRIWPAVGAIAINLFS